MTSLWERLVVEALASDPGALLGLLRNVGLYKKMKRLNVE